MEKNVFGPLLSISPIILTLHNHIHCYYTHCITLTITLILRPSHSYDTSTRHIPLITSHLPHLHLCTHHHPNIITLIAVALAASLFLHLTHRIRHTISHSPLYDQRHTPSQTAVELTVSPSPPSTFRISHLHYHTDIIKLTSITLTASLKQFQSAMTSLAHLPTHIILHTSNSYHRNHTYLLDLVDSADGDTSL